MDAANYVPVGRLDTEPAPSGPHPTAQERQAALQATLRGVDLGTYDDRLISWAVRTLDNPTLRTIASWIERAREAERQQAAVDVRAQLELMGREWQAIPAGERGPRDEEDTYRDGILRALAVLTGHRRPSRPAEVFLEGAAAGAQRHPSWCVRGAECSPGRDSELPEHRSRPYTIPAEPSVFADAEYRVTLTQSDGGPVLVEIVAGLPDAFDETATSHDLSMAQARRLSAVLAELTTYIDLGEVR